MNTAAQRLRKILEGAPTRLKTISDTEGEAPLASGKWSGKQILGHLIDSAANNHQRFVRAQLASPFSFPGYAQNEWVEIQRYQAETLADLIGLWESYNTHLLHVLENIPEEK